MFIGYARTSTADQVAGLEGQIRELEAKGCAKVYAEQVSATSAHRPELTACMDNLRAGDVLVVAKPDRLARSTADLLALVKDIEGKGAALLILSMGGQELDTRNPTSKLMLTMLAAVAEFERDLMKERQAEGIAKAKADGRYKGRKPTAMNQALKIRQMKAEGQKATDIAKALNISRMSVYRALKYV